MNRVAIYCRLSDEDKNKVNISDESESIQNQKNLLMRFALEKGWEIYKIYSDDDYSGLDKCRPSFNEMLKEAEFNKFNIILCKHQSRFTRDIELVEKYLHNKFIDWGIRFVTVVDGVDTFDKNNKKSRQINGLVNEWYCEDISEAIKSVFKLKQQQGKFIGSFPSFGYQKDPNIKNKLIIDPEASEIVKMIFNWYLKGYGIKQITYLLNEKQIPNPTKYKQLNGDKYINASMKDNYGLWNKTTVKRILRNEIYIGSMVQHKSEKLNYKSSKKISVQKNKWVVVENTHEPIIDKKKFSLVQNKLNSNTKSTGTGQPHIFAGKVRCSDCASTMQKSTNNKGNTYLRCKLYCIAPKKKLCKSHSINLNKLENLVTEKVKCYINTLNEDGVTAKLMEQANTKDKINVLEKQLKKVKKEIEDRDIALRNLYIDKIRQVISEEQFSKFNNSFSNEKIYLVQKQQMIEATIEQITSSLNNIDKYKEIVRKYKCFDKLTHIMVSELIDYIEIGEKNKKTKEHKIKIHWLF